jgi:hypothetical protein
VLKLQANVVSEAGPVEPDAELRGEKLAQVSVDEEGRWPLRLRVLTVLALGTLAWLAGLYVRGLVNDTIGFLLGLLVQALA